MHFNESKIKMKAAQIDNFEKLEQENISRLCLIGTF